MFSRLDEPPTLLHTYTTVNTVHERISLAVNGFQKPTSNAIRRKGISFVHFPMHDCGRLSSKALKTVHNVSCIIKFGCLIYILFRNIK